MKKLFLVGVFMLVLMVGLVSATDVSDCTELKAMVTNGYYDLVNDIDCSGESWTTTNFGGSNNGEVDGHGFTISNINASVSLFSPNGFHDVRFDNINIVSNTSDSGMIFNGLSSADEVGNISITNSVFNSTSSTSFATGVLADTCAGNFKNFYFENVILDVPFDDNVGIVCGQTSATFENIVVKDSKVFSTIDKVGGVFGSVQSGSVRNVVVDNVFVTNSGNGGQFIGESTIPTSSINDVVIIPNSDGGRETEMIQGNHHGTNIYTMNTSGVECEGTCIYDLAYFYNYSNVPMSSFDFNDFWSYAFEGVDTPVLKNFRGICDDIYFDFAFDGGVVNCPSGFSLTGNDIVVDFAGSTIVSTGDFVVSGDDVVVKNLSMNGTTIVSGDDVVLFDSVFNDNFSVTGASGLFYNNFFNGLVVDNVASTLWCKYDTMDDNTFTSNYSGLNPIGCLLASTFSDASTNFSAVSDWTDVNVLLDNSFGSVEWSSVDFSGESDLNFDYAVSIVDNSLSVDGLAYLNGSAEITFKDVYVHNAGEVTILAGGSPCGVLCANPSYDADTDEFSFDVTHFSTYSITYTEAFQPNYDSDDVAPMVSDGIGGLIYTLVFFAGIIAMGLLYLWIRKKINFNKKK